MEQPYYLSARLQEPVTVDDLQCELVDIYAKYHILQRRIAVLLTLNSLILIATILVLVRCR